MTTLKFRRIGFGEFEGHDEVCDFTESNASEAGCFDAASLTSRAAQALIDGWNRNCPDAWQYALVDPNASEAYAGQGSW
jgi:hypothetical protein